MLFHLARNNIQHAGVQYILDSVVRALDQNPDRRFIYVEIGFFWRWWNEQTDDMRNKVRGFVNDGKVFEISFHGKISVCFQQVDLNSSLVVGV